MLTVPSTFAGRRLSLHLLEPGTASAWVPWFATEADSLQVAGFLVGVGNPAVVIHEPLADLCDTTLTYVARRGGGRPIGFFQLHDIDLWSGTCQYSAYVSPPARRSLLAAELGLQGIDLALAGIGLRKLHAYVASGNADARVPLERLGFEHEATLRELVRRSDGTLSDVEVLSMTAADWAVVRRRVAKVLQPSAVAA